MISYRITQTTPAFEFTEFTPYTGGKWGASFLEQQFARCLEGKVGTVAYQETPARVLDLLLKTGCSCYMNGTAPFDIALPYDLKYSYNEEKGVYRNGIHVTL